MPHEKYSNWNETVVFDKNQIVKIDGNFSKLYAEALKVPEQERTEQQKQLISSVNETLGVSELPQQKAEAPTPSVEALKDVESTTKALENVDIKNIVPNSTVIKDENNQPLKVFHGSENKIKGDFRNENPNITGFFFTNDIENAKTYGNNIEEVYLNIKNPLVIDAKGLKFTDDIPVKVIAKYPGESPYETTIGLPIDEISYMVKNGKRPNQFIEIKDREKYDGIIFKNLIDPALSSRREVPQDTIVAFDNNQIIKTDNKSVSEAYHKAKENNSNPELVKSVEDLLGKKQELSQQKTEAPTPSVEAPKVEPIKKGKEAKPIKEKTFSDVGLKRADAKKTYAHVNSMDVPQTAEGIAMSWLSGGGKVSIESFADEVTGRKKSRGQGQYLIPTEAKKSEFTDSKSKTTIDQAAHLLWDDLPENIQENISDQDIRNALIDHLGSYEKRIDIAKDYIKEYDAEKAIEKFYQQDIEENKPEYEAERKELDDWYNERTSEDFEILKDKEFINQLIKEYETEFPKSTKRNIEEITPRQKGGSAEEVSGGEIVGKEKPTEAPAKELTSLEKAKEARRLAKEKLNGLRKNLGIIRDPKEEAKALFEYHKALVTEAKEYIKEGINTLKDFAKEIGEKIDDSLKAAWNEAKGLVKAAEKPEDVEHIADFLSSGENLEEWTGITKAKMSDIDAVKKIYEKETKRTWTEIQQQALEDVQKRYPRRSLQDAVRTRVEELAAKYDAKEDYNPTAKDLAVIQEFKRQTEKNINDLKPELDSENSIQRDVALMQMDSYQNDLTNIGKSLFTKEAGTAFGFRASESKMDENYGLQIRKADLIRANDGNPLSEADQKFLEDNWAKEKEIMKKEQEIREKGMMEEFDRKIAEIKKEYESKIKDKKPQLPAEARKKTLSQKGKDVANIIRTLKMTGAKVDFTLGTWNLAVESIAKLVEGGSTIAEAIDKLIKDKVIGFKVENDRVRFEDDLAAMVDNLSKRQTSLDAIKEIADETSNTTISEEMVKNGHIRDFVNSHIGEFDKDKILSEATKSLKEVLPNVDEQTVSRAFLKQGEFKQETKRSLEASIQQEKRELKRLLEKQAKKRLTKTEAQRAELQRLKESTKRKIKDFERRLREGEFEKEEPIILSKKQDAELIKLKKEENEVVSAFRKKQTELQEKNKHWAQRAADTARSVYVASLIGSPVTLAKVGYMSVVRPTSEIVRKQTLGRIFEIIAPSFARAAERGGEGSSLKALKAGLTAYFRQIGPEKLEQKYKKSINEYDQSAKTYYDAVAQKADAKTLSKLKEKMDNALLNAYGNVIFQFLGGSSLKDAWQSFVNRSNEIEKQFGKVDVESIKDGDALDKMNYIMGFIGRSHAAAKTFSGRFSYAVAFMTRLEAAMKDGSISDANKVLEIAHESYLDWDNGKYQQDNWVTNKWNDIVATIRKNTSRNPKWKAFDKALEFSTKSEVAITRVPVNVIHEQVAEYLTGALRAPWLAYKEYARAKNLAIDEGYSKALDSKEFKDQIKKNIQNMDAEQAAKIYRLFTKGGLGLGLYGATVIWGLMQFGVFPHKGQKKKKEEEYLEPGELNPGQIMFGKTKLGETMSKLIEHTPALWPTFMGLGIAKIYADDVKSGKTTAQAAWDAIYTHLDVIQSGIPQSKIPFFNPLGLVKDVGKSFLGKLSTYGIFDNYIDGKGGLIDQEQKKLELTSPQVLRLKEFKVEMPKLSKRDKHKITPDKNHPQVGVDKEGKPYAYMNDLEWNKYVEYRANFINDALDEIYAYEVDAKNAHKQDPENMPDFNLDKPIMQMALDKIIRKANALAKNRLIDEGYLPEKDKEVDETYTDIEKLLQRLYKENKIGGEEGESQQPPTQQPEPDAEFIPMEQIQVPED